MSNIKKVNMLYLLNNRIWHLKVTPEISKKVQLALFDIDVIWRYGGEKIVKYMDEKWLTRNNDELLYNNCYSYESLELEEIKNDFTTQQEIWEWLINGGSVTYINGNIPTISFKNGFIDSGCAYSGYSFSYSDEWKKDNKWYEKLDGEYNNSKLCYCRDRKDELKAIRLIVSFNNNVFKDDKGNVFTDVTPLTKDELKCFINES